METLLKKENVEKLIHLYYEAMTIYNRNEINEKYLSSGICFAYRKIFREDLGEDKYFISFSPNKEGGTFYWFEPYHKNLDVEKSLVPRFNLLREILKDMEERGMP